MNGLEKSDSGIVVTKPANKGPSGPAELVERRPGPEGNPEGQSTGRAQKRTTRVTGGRPGTDRLMASRDHPREEPYALARPYGSARGDRGNPVPYRD